MRKRIHLTPAEAAAKGLLCRTHLKALRLMPAPDARPAATVWQGQGAYNVYTVENCVPWRWEPGPAQRRRKSVCAQAQALIDMNCLVLDVESTGTGYDDEVCEIAIVDANGMPIIETLIRPTQPIPPQATAIHGITNSMVATAPSWPEVAKQYEDAVAGRTVVAYNASFDTRLIRQTHQRHKLTAPTLTTACLMQMFSVWNGEWDNSRDRWRWLGSSQKTENKAR
ncbi:3'-5' exonuclease DinG [Pseudomonas sichuanensis]|nr:3'-5' exonuclease DinG [Pseudomonas sichuanensis]